MNLYHIKLTVKWVFLYFLWKPVSSGSIYGKCEETLTLWISATKANRIYLVTEFYKELEILLFHLPELWSGLNLPQPVLGVGGRRRPSSNRTKGLTNTKEVQYRKCVCSQSVVITAVRYTSFVWHVCQRKQLTHLCLVLLVLFETSDRLVRWVLAWCLALISRCQ